MPARTHSDEPTAVDLLERKKYAQGLARLAESGATPMVIGIYGTWGMGKTSLMRLIEMELDRTKVRPLWFNPWEHQFDDNPVVALVYKIMEQTGRKWEQSAKKTLALFAAALASGAVKGAAKYFTGWDFTIKDLLHLGKHYFENQFLVRDFRMKLRDELEQLVKKVRTEGYQNRRLVFFIDDLDRCLDDQALKLLEALKLYLNLEGCVFFLGLNREAMESAIRSRYPDLNTRADYLDKIIQLPFHLPPIDADNRKQFVARLLGQELANCGALLADTLGENPRKVKRFINKLIVNDSLAQALAIPDYDVRVLALILLIQDAHYPFYLKIAEKPDRLKELQQDNQDERTKAWAKQFLDPSEPLRGIVRAFPVPAKTDLTPYIHLVRVTRAEPQEEEPPPEGGRRKVNSEDLQSILDSHAEWVKTNGKKGERADLGGADLRTADLLEADLRAADLNRANLVNSDLLRVNFNQANLHEANLRVADLREANLRRANLHGADLRQANLRGADLTLANLRGADLKGAIITEQQISTAVTDSDTILPDGSKMKTPGEESEKPKAKQKSPPRRRKPAPESGE
jgi:hypothetical protein